jgi:uncharacterized protein (DUF1501 family)
MSTVRITRRGVLASGIGSLGFGLTGWSALENRPVWADQTEKRQADACILLFLEGGPSHIDTFDPKPGAKTNGPFEAIDTKITGVKFGQHLPRLAEVADKLAILRSLTSKEGDHERAYSLLHTGYLPTPKVAYPGLGSTLARAWQSPTAEVPLFVSLGKTVGAGVLGPQFGPLAVSDAANPAPGLELPEGMTETRVERRLKALAGFNAKFGTTYGSNLGADSTKLTQRANALRKHEVFKPFNLQEAEPETFERYGGSTNDGYLARACHLARRLVESGVRFVEIEYSGWDTHADNFGAVQGLCSSLDPALASLISDLADRGLLQRTLVACVGEFGRTPDINGDNGRDHHPDVFSALLAGGGIAGGQVYGASDDEGAQVKDRPVSVADFHATMFTALGLDITKDYFAPDGRTLKLTNGGTPVKELL